MAEVKTEYPDDIDALKALAEAQAAELERRDSRIEYLEGQLRLMLSQRFSASSEAVGSDLQLGLFNEAEVEAEAEPVADEPSSTPVSAHCRRRAGRRPLPSHFPRHEVVYDLADADKVCPHDGTALAPIGADTSEQLDIVPASVRVLVHKRLKYACPCCEQWVKTAPMTAQPIPKSQASPGLLSFVAVSKYVDALPLNRQSKQFERIGVSLPRSTLASWMVRSGELVTPLINLLREELLSQAYIQMDETTVQVLKEPGREPQSKSYVWCQRGTEPERPLVLFHYAPSRSGEVAKYLLGDFAGFLHTDGYEGYNAVVACNEITQLYCFAHARRRFTDVLKSLGLNPKKLPDKPPDKARRVMQALGLIRLLYDIERRIREQPPDERYRLRQTESLPALQRLRAWLDATQPKVAPQTPLGKALSYLDNHWAGLNRYCDDGRLGIDNNRVENAIRPFVIGRKNWLFSDTVNGAKASANLYSLLESAKLNHLEPYAYLKHVFTELPKATAVEHFEALLPYRVDLPALNKTI